MDFETAISDDNFVTVPFIVIYKYPADYPNKYVARLWDGLISTSYVALSDTLEGVRAAIPLTMTCLERSPDDDPCIVEVWL